MSQKKPGLIIFVSVYLFFCALIFLALSVFIFIPDMKISLENLIIFAVFISFSCFISATGIGILKRKKWARITSIVFLGLLLFSGISTLSDTLSGESIDTVSTKAYVLGQVLGALLILISSGISLYAMTHNQSVKNYFNRD